MIPDILLSPERLKEAAGYFGSQPAFSFDIESSGENRGIPHLNNVTWLSMATYDRIIVIPFGHTIGDEITGARRESKLCADGKIRTYEYPIWEDPPHQLQRERVFDILEPLFFSDSIIKVAHNAIFDLASIAKYYGAVPSPPYGDSLVTAWLVNENHKRYGLKYMTKRDFNFEYDEEDVGRCVERHPFSTVARYAAWDAEYCWKLWLKYRPLIDEEGVYQVWQLEHDLISTLVGMRLAGARVDSARLEEMREELTILREEKTHKVWEAAGAKFNLNSYPQKQKILFDPHEKGGQGLKPWRRTRNDGDSTDRALLESYPDNPVCQALIEYADVEKILNTYVLAYLGEGKKESQLFGEHIYAIFKQYGTVTGRFSCAEPNLQQIPRPDSDLGKMIRGAFIAEEGGKLVVADYGQIEMVLLAHYVGYGKLFEGFWQGIDPHIQTASVLFQKSVADVTKHERQIAKNCVPMDTEALTRSGWKKYDELQVGDLVLGYDGVNAIWTPVQGKIYIPDAPLVTMQNGRGWKLTSTPDHRWDTRRRRTRKRTLVREFTTTQEINTEHRITVSAPVRCQNELAITVQEAALIGWLHTDGHIRRGKYVGANSQAGGKRVMFHGSIFQSSPHNPEFCGVIDDLLRGVVHKKYVRPSGIVQWSLNPSFLRELWKRARLDEITLEEFVCLLGPEEIRAFLTACYQAEGLKGTNYIRQNAGPVLDAMRTAGFLLGHSATISGVKHWCKYLHLGKPVITGKKLVKVDAGHAPVWCIQTGTGNWVMRQGNSVILTGNCNFAINYGAGIDKVAAMSGITYEHARKVLRKHRNEFPEIYEFKGRILERCHRTGHITTILGRKRRLPHINSPFQSMRAYSERQAFNSLIQGGSADLTKYAMVRADNDPRMDDDIQIILTVHDEIVLSAPEHKAELAADILREAMIGDEMQRLIRVPLKADVKICDRWSEAK